MSSQVVFRLQSRTGHQSIKQVEESIPSIDKHEVLVKIRAVSLNFRDVVIANGGYPFPVKDKVVPCSDCAGEIIEIGSSVEDFANGDNVMAVFDPTNLFGPQKDWNHGHGGPVDGVLREYVAFPGSALIKIPKESSLSFSQMAALVCTGVTAWNVLYGHQPLKPGHTVLFQGTCSFAQANLPFASTYINSVTRYRRCLHHWPHPCKGCWSHNHYHFLFRRKARTRPEEIRSRLYHQLQEDARLGK